MMNMKRLVGGEDFVVVSFCFVSPRESNCLLGFSDSDPRSSRKLTSYAENSRSTIIVPVWASASATSFPTAD